MLFELGYWFVFVFLAGVLVGAGGVLYGVLHVYRRWERLQAKAELKDTPYVEPRPSEGTREHLKEQGSQQKRHRESIECVNVLMDFLFFQLRDTVRVKRQVLQLADRNLKFLMTKSGLGKICKRMKVIELNMGSEMPHLSNVEIVPPEIGTVGSSDSLQLNADFSYKGKCNLRIEADLILKRKAIISITVVELSGRGRFTFESEPHPHWTFGFFERQDQPKLDLEVEALIDNRSFSQIAHIVKGQVRVFVWTVLVCLCVCV